MYWNAFGHIRCLDNPLSPNHACLLGCRFNPLTSGIGMGVGVVEMWGPCKSKVFLGQGACTLVVEMGARIMTINESVRDPTC